jgi:hypothetical protein
MRLKEVSVAIVLGAWESHVQGEGPHRERRQVDNTLNAKAWESSPMSAEHERQKTSHGVAVCGESRTHGDNGGDGETGREAPRSVPTHLHAKRVRAGKAALSSPTRSQRDSPLWWA